jgi:hypothetical protein
MTTRELLILAYLVTVAIFAALLVYRLGWHWLAWWGVAPASFLGFAFVGGMIDGAIAFFTGNRRK